jgi:hypothetical protein
MQHLSDLLMALSELLDEMRQVMDVAITSSFEAVTVNMVASIYAAFAQFDAQHHIEEEALRWLCSD